MVLLHAILALLARGPRHGYRLRAELEEELGAEWALDAGQLYKLLARIEREGWAQARREASGQGPRRKVFRITARGRAQLRRWARSTEGGRERGRDAFAVKQLAAADAAPLRLLGSDDLLLSVLRERAASRCRGPGISAAAIGSLGGLLALRDRRADLAGVHLLDVDSGVYNVPFVRQLLPEEPVLLLHLARREQGLFVAPGNPRRVRGVRDLARRDLRYVNRQRDAGTRLFVYHALRKAKVEPRDIRGYQREVTTHDQVAQAVASGSADVGPGIRAVAEKHGLDFLPLGEESFELAIPEAAFESKRLRPFLELIHDADSVRCGAALSGYDTTRMNRIVARVR
jgi:molybdate-binding protein/DNA-binding PadR family transcriptional regulator